MDSNLTAHYKSKAVTSRKLWYETTLLALPPHLYLTTYSIHTLVLAESEQSPMEKIIGINWSDGTSTIITDTGIITVPTSEVQQ